jgi:glycosyltransferase involved in cell wall biosynthesis
VLHQENKGVSVARNTGLDMASGDFIGFVDSDDYINERMYEVLLSNCLKFGAEVSVCRLARFEGESVLMELKQSDKINVISAREALINMHGRDGQVYTIPCNKLYRKDLFEGLRYPSNKINEDEFLTYKVMDNAKRIVLTEEVLYYYSVNNGSITCNPHYPMTPDIFEMLEDRKNYFIQRGYTDLIPFVHKAYLDRVIARYRLIKTTGRAQRCDLAVLKKRYRECYMKARNDVRGIGYKIFSFTPNGYFTLLNIKRVFGGRNTV